MSGEIAAVSHGRGGQGNIGPDETSYIDGEILRQGDPSATGGAYSSGRGGAGNIGSPQHKPVDKGNDDDIVPDVANVPRHEDQAYHSGRGGEGNVLHPAGEHTKHQEGYADKLKRKLFGKK